MKSALRRLASLSSLLAAVLAPAHATIITVGGQSYDIVVRERNYLVDDSSFSTTLMPWWGDSNKARDFANAAGTALGTTYGPFNSWGPFFAYQVSISSQGQQSFGYLNGFGYTAASGGVNVGSRSYDAYADYALVNVVAGGGANVPEPGSLALVGLAGFAGLFVARRRAR